MYPDLFGIVVVDSIRNSIRRGVFFVVSLNKLDWDDDLLKVLLLDGRSGLCLSWSGVSCQEVGLGLYTAGKASVIRIDASHFEKVPDAPYRYSALTVRKRFDIADGNEQWRGSVFA